MVACQENNQYMVCTSLIIPELHDFALNLKIYA
jgi:hypothetical protein